MALLRAGWNFRLGLPSHNAPCGVVRPSHKKVRLPTIPKAHPGSEVLRAPAARNVGPSRPGEPASR